MSADYKSYFDYIVKQAAANLVLPPGIVNLSKFVKPEFVKMPAKLKYHIDDFIPKWKVTLTKADGNSVQFDIRRGKPNNDKLELPGLYDEAWRTRNTLVALNYQAPVELKIKIDQCDVR